MDDDHTRPSGDVADWPPERVDLRARERLDLQRREVESFLRGELLEGYSGRRERLWDRDYGSIEAYRASVASNRARWEKLLGTEWGAAAGAFAPEREPFLSTGAVDAEWHAIRLLEGTRLRGRAILGLPADADGPRPLVICAHGATSSPETVFGFGDERDLYHAFARRLVEAGYAVLAPRDLQGDHERRRLEVFAQSLGNTVWGLELFRTRRLLDYLEEHPLVDVGRVGMWGLSMGGASTLFHVPLLERVDAAICAGFFNHRLRKHVAEEPLYSHFRPIEESIHFFVPGWFREFADADLASLICPRPFMVQTGRYDRIAWEPDVHEEYDRAAAHYERLGLGDRIEHCRHDGGHEVDVEAGVEFLDDHLR